MLEIQDQGKAKRLSTGGEQYRLSVVLKVCMGCQRCVFDKARRQEITYSKRNEGFDWAALHGDSCCHHLNNPSVEHFVSQRHASNCHELDLEDDITARVLHNPIVNLESLIVFVAKANPYSKLATKSVNKESFH